MMRACFYALVAACIVACHPTPPAPAPLPDASDAAVLGDAPLDDCQRGCAALAAPAVRCSFTPDGGDCALFLRELQDSGKQPNPMTHRPLTCADIANVRTKVDAQNLGIVCRP